MSGNPNPSPETRFGAGNRANPIGKTSEQRRQEIENGEKAARLRGKLLDAYEGSLIHAGLESTDDLTACLEILKGMTNEVLRLLKDSEDRAFGAPRQDVSISDNRDPEELDDDELAKIAASGGGSGTSDPEE